MHINCVSNGLGAPSVRLLLMAIRGEIPATVSITADTGWENDRLWNTGRRSTNEEYFNEIIVPLCKGTRVAPYFVRSVDKYKRPLPGLGEILTRDIAKGRPTHVPLYGSRGGQMMQSCTDKMKIRAIRQQLRRLGAKTAHCAQGIHFYEAARRTKGIFLRMEDWISIYQTTVLENKIDPITGKPMIDPTTKKRVKINKIIKWLTHSYPLVDRSMNRADIYAEIEKEGIPYITSSECDLCPHKDLARWERSTPETIERGAELERQMGGSFFFTPLRIPLLEALIVMRADRVANPEKYKTDTSDFGCNNPVCGT